ncbi:MAG: right-handed parallel beta-helix repeat-containing protein, partial [Thermoplasmata archaeon]
MKGNYCWNSTDTISFSASQGYLHSEGTCTPLTPAPSYLKSRYNYPPLRFNSNTDLLSFAVTEAESGSGTSSDPYIFRYIEIDGSGKGYCLFFGNTTLYCNFISCRFYNANGGIPSPYVWNSSVGLYNAQNIQFINCTFNNSNYGIYSLQSINITVSGAHISNISSTGIYLGNQSTLTISNSSFSNNPYGIHVFSSTGFIYSSQFRNHSQTAIYGSYYGPPLNLIADRNTINGTGSWAIYATGGGGNYITTNNSLI